MNFKLVSDFEPTGDQPEAIRQLVDGLEKGVPYQTLLGVTGSGKTFTIANVIEKVQRPVLVLSHNKTLAAQHAVFLDDRRLIAGKPDRLDRTVADAFVTVLAVCGFQLQILCQLRHLLYKNHRY